MKRQKVTFYVTPELYKIIHAGAWISRLSESSWIEKVLRAAWDVKGEITLTKRRIPKDAKYMPPSVPESPPEELFKQKHSRNRVRKNYTLSTRIIKSLIRESKLQNISRSCILEVLLRSALKMEPLDKPTALNAWYKLPKYMREQAKKDFELDLVEERKVWPKRRRKDHIKNFIKEHKCLEKAKDLAYYKTLGED